MRSFNVGRFGSSDDPWFRVGNVDVSTTVLVTAMSVMAMVIWAIEGPARSISKWFWLGGTDVTSGQIWRLLTWPIPYGPSPVYSPSIWTIITLVIFVWFGSSLEGVMGRRQFTMYLLMMTVIPALVVTLYETVSGSIGLVTNLRDLEFGVFIGFVLRYPMLKFFGSIPGWVLAGIFVAIEAIQDIGNRNDHGLVVLIAVIVTSVFSLRALGYAEEADFVPKLPLPTAMTGMSPPSRPAAGGKSTARRKRRGRAKLSAVPPPTSAPRKELTKLEAAEMDAILDQVSEQGIDSLTPQQRERLESHSKRLRRRDDT